MDKVHSNNLQASRSSLWYWPEIYHSIVRGFYRDHFLLWILIYFPIYKSLSESAFHKCYFGQCTVNGISCTRKKPNGNNVAAASVSWTVGHFKKSINFANCSIKLSFPEEHEICWGQYYSANQTGDLWFSPLSAQTSKVRGFGRRGVGGTNPADPRGLPTLISTRSALHYLEPNRQAPHYTNESTSVEILSLQTACLFLSSKLIVIICFLIVVADRCFSFCRGRPPKACHGVNVMLHLRVSFLQWQLVPQQPVSPACRRPFGDVTRPSYRKSDA